jgi:hypothetical protein
MHVHVGPQVLAFVLYHFVVNFILEPTALQCFNHTLDLLKGDPRVTVRLGATEDIRGACVWWLICCAAL